MADNLIPIDFPEDPKRCQAVNTQGQCTWKALPESQYCACHGGNKAQASAEKQRLNNYRLTKFQDRLERLGNSEGIKSLRDEVAILRMIMEEKLNMCEDISELILQSHSISDLVIKIDKVVSSCHKLEGSMGQLLDKTAILQFAAEVITIIGDIVHDENQITQIADGIYAAVGRIGEA